MSGDNIKAFYAFLVSVFALLGMVGVLGYFAMKTVSMSTIKYCRRRGGDTTLLHLNQSLSFSLSLERARAACVPASACAYIPLTHAACCTYVLRVRVRRWKGGAALTGPLTASKGREWFAPPQVTRANAWRRLWQGRLPQQAGR